MGLNVGNAPVKQVYVGSTPVKAVYIGAVKIWPIGPRVVTVRTGDYTHMGFDTSWATGDTDLIGGWPEFWGEQGVSFTAPVTCDQNVNELGTYSRIKAGTTIPAGQGVLATIVSEFATHVFTEVL